MTSKEYKIDGRESTIFRVKKSADNPYVMVDRRPIDNPALSFKAKGILTYLMSRPDGWEVNITDLMNHSADGASAIRSGLNELRDAHHVLYNTEREGGHIKRWVIEVYEIPYCDPLTKEQIEELPNDLLCDFQQVENLQIENLQVGNQRQVLSTLSNTESNQYKEEAAKSSEVFTFYQNNVEMLTPYNSQILGDFIDTYSAHWVMEALKDCVEYNHKNIRYCEAILKGWKDNGFRVDNRQKGNYAKPNYRTQRPVTPAPIVTDEQRALARQILAGD
jgi:DnaD/phage-associated family protein